MATYSFAVGPIVGSSGFCDGTTSTYTDATPGGTWSSSNVAIATISSTTGIATGVSAGTTMLTYNVSGVYSTMVVTVFPMPTAISGASSVCAGSAITVTDATTGGAWSSTMSTISIGMATGIITGLTSGTATITYTLSSGCYVWRTITVNPLPDTISGLTNICLGSSTTLTDMISGGVWTSTVPSIATVGMSTGVTTGNAIGTAYINYTISTGCAITKTVNVASSATAPITGSTAVCVGGTTTLTNAMSGGTWTSAATTVATVTSGGAVTGILSGGDLISYTTTCGIVTTTVNVNPLPTLHSVTGGGSYCSGGVGVSIYLSTSSIGVSYQLYLGSLAVGAPLAGTGAVLNFGLQTAAGVYTVVATNATTGCSATMAGSVSISINPLPMVNNITGGGSYCAGSTGVHIGLDGSSSGINYQLYNGSTIVGSAIAGTGTPLDFGLITAAGTYHVVATNATTTCTNTMSGTVTVTINPLPVMSATATPVTCSNIVGLASTSTGAVSYNWSPTTGLSCGACASPTVNPASTIVYTLTGTSSLGCVSSTTVTVNGNRIYGHISFSAAIPDTIDMKVWLIQFNSIDSSIAALDSTITCAVDSTPYFEFDGRAAGNYMVKAKLLYGTVAGASGYIPTYSLSSPHWDSAATVAHTTNSDSMHINMVYGTVPTGPGFIAGYVVSGAGRGTTGDVPAVGMLIYLKDVAGHILTYTYTDAAGYYSFSSLANGSYIIYPTAYQYRTTPSAVITLTTAMESYTAIDFRQRTTSRTIIPYVIPSGIPTISTKGFAIFPNPTSGDLNFEWNSQVAGNAEVVIADITGREVYRTTINMTSANGNTHLQVNGLNNGLYLLSIHSATTNYSGKLMAQE